MKNLEKFKIGFSIGANESTKLHLNPSKGMRNVMNKAKRAEKADKILEFLNKWIKH
ncbi:hypothetical protein [Sharpea porci]|uniref:hypothetical protein n=1 Tax=Sharpea porci TaxID=2652286 RepID=UPI002A91C21E|nr:hypothetical protein [Sharpea porci]MDY5279435.1 hypothetical protein [Sharpea porci]